MTQEQIKNSIKTNIDYLESLIDKMKDFTAQAREAAQGGNMNRAIGTLCCTRQDFEDADAVFKAIMAINKVRVP